jgi:hypothetical protein
MEPAAAAATGGRCRRYKAQFGSGFLFSFAVKLRQQRVQAIKLEMKAVRSPE